MRWRTYGALVYGWIVENQKPHTNWAAANAGDPDAASRKAAQISFH
jgi:hypothetical protein